MSWAATSPTSSNVKDPAPPTPTCSHTPGPPSWPTLAASVSQGVSLINESNYVRLPASFLQSVLAVSQPFCQADDITERQKRVGQELCVLQGALSLQFVSGSGQDRRAWTLQENTLLFTENSSSGKEKVSITLFNSSSLLFFNKNTKCFTSSWAKRTHTHRDNFVMKYKNQNYSLKQDWRVSQVRPNQDLESLPSPKWRNTETRWKSKDQKQGWNEQRNTGMKTGDQFWTWTSYGPWFFRDVKQTCHGSTHLMYSRPECVLKPE